MKCKNSLLEADLTIMCRTQEITLKITYRKKTPLHGQYNNMGIP